MNIYRIINVEALPVHTSEPLPARMYNGLDKRVGYPVIDTLPIQKPLKKRKPWWKFLVGL